MFNILKYSNKNKLILTLISLTSLKFSSLFYIYCDDSKRSVSNKIEENNKNEKNQNEVIIDEWEKEKLKCSLCRMFLTSPCRLQVNNI